MKLSSNEVTLLLNTIHTSIDYYKDVGINGKTYQDLVELESQLKAYNTSYLIKYKNEGA
jgi:hypothetical protein